MLTGHIKAELTSKCEEFAGIFLKTEWSRQDSGKTAVAGSEKVVKIVLAQSSVNPFSQSEFLISIFSDAQAQPEVSDDLLRAHP